MTIYNLYIFDRNGTILLYKEWSRTKQSGMSIEEEAKLMYGMLFSIKSFVSKISPYDSKEGFLYYKTNKYALNYLETPSGLKFVMNTDITATRDARELLQEIYAKVYVEYIVKNPVCQLNAPITSDLFGAKLDELVKKTSIYNTKHL